MGHSPGKSAVVNYTHLNQLREHFTRAVESQFQSLLNTIQDRARELGILVTSRGPADEGESGVRVMNPVDDEERFPNGELSKIGRP